MVENRELVLIIAVAFVVAIGVSLATISITGNMANGATGNAVATTSGTDSSVYTKAEIDKKLSPFTMNCPSRGVCELSGINGGTTFGLDLSIGSKGNNNKVTLAGNTRITETLEVGANLQITGKISNSVLASCTYSKSTRKLSCPGKSSVSVVSKGYVCYDSSGMIFPSQSPCI